jgi:hypothetical protein
VLLIGLLLSVPYALSWVPIVHVSADTGPSIALWPVVVVAEDDPCAAFHEMHHVREAARTGVIPWYLGYGASWLNAGGDPWAMPQEQRAVAAEPDQCARPKYARKLDGE